MSFQENLKHYREKAGYKTAKEFADILSVPYPTYAAYENKNSEPKYEMLCKIADLLQVSTDDLLGRTTNILGNNEDEELEKIIAESLKKGNCELLKLSKIETDFVFFNFDNLIKNFKIDKKFILDNLNKIKSTSLENEKNFRSRFFKFIQDTILITFGEQQINSFQKLIDNATNTKTKKQLEDDLSKQVVLFKMFKEKYNKDYPDYLQENK